MSLLDDFLVRALLAGIGAALAAAPLGCFVVWRRMAYVGDASAHASILGVALALLFNISIMLGVLVVALLMAIALSSFSQRNYSTDTLLGVMAHSSLATGLVIVSLMPNVRVDLMAYLFGDILAVNRMDLLVIWLGAFAVIAFLWLRWSSLLTSTLNTDLAYASNISPKREQLMLSIALALVVAISLKVVGALLITALLIIPPAIARAIARTPEQMAVTAFCAAAGSIVLGLWASFEFDTPTGPSIVCAATALFVLSTLVSKRS